MFNILISDVGDGLCNGAMGELIGVERHYDDSINKLIVQFDNPNTGAASRENYPSLSKKYPSGTVIGSKEVEYSLAKSKSLVSSTAKLVQFPIIAAFAVTGLYFTICHFYLINVLLLLFCLKD